MSKYSVRVAASSEDSSNWKAEIVRRATKRNSVVSKAQDGFASEAEAQSWGAEELKGFLKVEASRKERRAD